MFQFARLMASIALEGLAAVGHVILFLLRRRDQRGRIHALILGQAPRTKALPVTALFALFPLLAVFWRAVPRRSLRMRRSRATRG